MFEKQIYCKMDMQVWGVNANNRFLGSFFMFWNSTSTAEFFLP